MRYFQNCTTLTEAKTLYRKLAMDNHPDRGGSVEVMQEINTEFAFACAYLAKKAGMTDEESDIELKLSEQYRQVVEKIIVLPGITIELVGNWIWVTGDTRPVHVELKRADFQWAPKKKAWYFRNEMFKCRGSGASLEEIRTKYGSATIRGIKPFRTLPNR